MYWLRGAMGVRCPELGGVRSQRFKCTVSMGKSIGGMSFVRCIEVVRFSEGPLLEVLLYRSTTTLLQSMLVPPFSSTTHGAFKQQTKIPVVDLYTNTHHFIAYTWPCDITFQYNLTHIQTHNPQIIMFSFKSYFFFPAATLAFLVPRTFF